MRAALFDAGDTLIHQWTHKGDRFCWLCEQAGLPVPPDPEMRRRAAWATERFFAFRHTHPEQGRPSFWTEWATVGLRELDLSTDSIPILQRTASSLPRTQWLDPEAIPLLQALRAKGYKIGIASNWDGTLAQCFEEVGLTSHVDYIGDSHIFGARKPDVTFFHHVLERLGVEPGHTFHVGDSWGTDVIGAEAAGITPVLLDCIGQEERPARHRIQRLGEILALCDVL